MYRKLTITLLLIMFLAVISFGVNYAPKAMAGGCDVKTSCCTCGEKCACDNCDCAKGACRSEKCCKCGENCKCENCKCKAGACK